MSLIIIKLSLISSPGNMDSLEELENKIEEERVPIDNHSMWEDIIGWRDAVEEVEKLESLLKELKH